MLILSATYLLLFGKIVYRTVDWRKIIDFGYGGLYEIAPVVNRSVGRI